MGLSVKQTSAVPTEHLEEPFAVFTNKCSRSAEAVFAVLPSQLLVEATDPFLLLSDTVGGCANWLMHIHMDLDLTPQHCCRFDMYVLEQQLGPWHKPSSIQ